MCLHVEVGTEVKNRLLLLSNLFKLMIKTWKISGKDNKISSIVQGAFWLINPVLAWWGDFEQFAASTESCGAKCHCKVNMIVTMYFSHNLFTALNNVTSYLHFFLCNIFHPHNLPVLTIIYLWSTTHEN